MIPLKWEVIQVGLSEGFHKEGLLLRVSLRQGGSLCAAQEYLTKKECTTPYLCLALERLQDGLLEYIKEKEYEQH